MIKARMRESAEDRPGGVISILAPGMEVNGSLTSEFLEAPPGSPPMWKTVQRVVYAVFVLYEGRLSTELPTGGSQVVHKAFYLVPRSR